MITVQQTQDYNSIKTSLYQPEKRVRATHDLVDSLKKTNGNYLAPAIIHADTGAVIDGHRRLEACRLADVPFYYIEASNDMMEDKQLIQALNTTSRPWCLSDYISSYASYKEEYKELEMFLIDKNVSTDPVFSLSNISAKIVKAGVELDVDYEKLSERLEVFELIKSKYKGMTPRDIHISLGKLYKLGDRFQSSRLKEQLDKYEKDGKIRVPERNKHFFVRELTKVYDYKKKGVAVKSLMRELVTDKIIPA